MATYTATAAATILQRWDSSPLAQRVEILLVRQAASRSQVATGNELAYIKTISKGAASVAAAVLPVVVAQVDVGSPGSDREPNLPSDAELALAVSGIWPFLSS